MIFRGISTGRVQIARAALLIGLACVSAGCNEAGKATPDAMMREYQAGQYREARQTAQQVANQSLGRQRDEARYIAGLSAYRLGKSQDALDDLEPLTNNPDNELAGNAAATVGMIYIDLKQDNRALSALQIAAQRLRGNYLARVYHYIGQIHQRAGRWAEGRTAMSLALSNATDPKLQRVIREQMDVSAFTLQFGAYAQPATADSRLRAVTPRVNAARIGTATVQPSVMEDGRRLYLVQAGRFVTHDQAARARDRLGLSDVIIVPAFN